MKTLDAKLKDCLRFAHWRCRNDGRSAPQITLRWLRKRWQRQRGRCPIFGIAMTFKGPRGITLDQINPGKGYTRKNTQLVTSCGNAFKGKMTMQETRALWREIVTLRSRRAA